MSIKVIIALTNTSRHVPKIGKFSRNANVCPDPIYLGRALTVDEFNECNSGVLFALRKQQLYPKVSIIQVDDRIEMREEKYASLVALAMRMNEDIGARPKELTDACVNEIEEQLEQRQADFRGRLAVLRDRALSVDLELSPPETLTDEYLKITSAAIGKEERKASDAEKASAPKKPSSPPKPTTTKKDDK